MTPAVPVLQSVVSGPTYQRRINTCKAELQQLVQQKREQCSAERMAKQMMESAEWESRPPPPGEHARLAICQSGWSSLGHGLQHLRLNLPLLVEKETTHQV